MGFQTIDPSTGSPLAVHRPLSEAELGQALDRAGRAWRDWAMTSFDERAKHMLGLARLLRERKRAHAELMAREMGKPLAQGEAESEKCAWVCEYYAAETARLLADLPIPTGSGESFLAFRPLGVIFAVMPWNFPFWQVFRAAAPTLMAGNGFTLKHAPNVAGCAELIESLYREAGFPDGVFTNLPIEVELVVAAIAHPAVRGVTLTGSERAGRAVAAEAGRQLKKSILELGGSDPYIVLADADVAKAVELCVASRMLNAGQVCISAKRFVVVDAVRNDFEERLRETMAGYEMQPPLEPGARLGPLARRDLRDTLDAQVGRSRAAGARLVLGGSTPSQPGWWYPATILLDVRPGNPAFEEELFGPVACVVPARDETEAMALANASRFGLGGAIFTRDIERGRALARDRLDVGVCAVNDFVKSDPRLPFGGIKSSGYGHELGMLGIHEFVNAKTVVIAG